MIKPWDNSFNIDDAFYSISNDGTQAISDFIKKSSIAQTYSTILEVQELKLDELLRNSLSSDIENITKILNDLFGFIIVKPIDGLNIFEQAVVPWIMAQLMGDTIGQNYDNDKIYIVNDLGGKMEDGHRYSRTNQGGSVHTDGVNIKDPFNYFLLHIISEGLYGGESIIVNGLTIYNYLRESIPEVISILNKNILWEYKGVKEGKFYKEPIVKLVDGIPMWRYLRNYIEEAAVKNDAMLSSEIIWAMDCLDSVLESSSMQLRYTVKQGETVFFNDRNIFHGRTSYIDPIGSEYFSDINKNRTTNAILRRTGLRIWVKSTY